MTIRLMIIDDHDLVRAGLEQYFKMHPGVEVVAEASNGEELLKKLETSRVDVLLLDMIMPGLCGVGLIKQVKHLYPGLHILMLSAHDEAQLVLEAIRAGASGYVSKMSTQQTLCEAINDVMANGKYISQNIVDRLEYASDSTATDIELFEVEENFAHIELQEQ